MNTFMRTAWVVLAIFCAAVGLSAQTATSTVPDDLARADRQFDLYAYNLALRSYEQVLKQDPQNAHALARIGDCYFQLNRPEESLTWYDRAAMQDRVEPEALYRYGRALMHTGDYVGAKKWFTFYAKTDPKVGNHFADMCDYAIAAGQKAGLYTAKDEPVNTEAADYGPAFFGAKVAYNSARTDILRATQAKDGQDWSGSAFNQLFVTQRAASDGYLQRPAFLRSDLQNVYNEGPVSFSGDGKRVAFCRNNFINGTRQIAEKGINMSLHTGEVVDGNWVNVHAFPYNGADFATGFPSLSPDGNTLYFASNQPNGYGGWDLYESHWIATGWSAPQNLGPTVNTPGNEVTPYFDGTTLYFSSDWHRGLGGLDVFRADLKNNDVTGVYHLGPGINSPRDDYGFIYDANQNIGYLTSNRADGRGNEDLWQITKKKMDAPVMASTPTTAAPRTPGGPAADANPPAPQTYSTPTSNSATKYYLLVSDEAGNPVPEANLDLTQCSGMYGKTDYQGKYYFNGLYRPVDCAVEITKEGFETAVIPITAFGSGNIALSINLDRSNDFFGTVLDGRERTTLPGATVQMTTGDGKIVQTTTDHNGTFKMRLHSGSTYELTYFKEGYKELTVKARPGAAGMGNELSPVYLEKMPLNSMTPMTASTTPAQYSYSKSAQYNSPTPNSTALLSTAKTAAPVDAGPVDGYSVQVAAYPEQPDNAKLAQYESLTSLGNLYSKQEGNGYKVRLGIFATKKEAEEAERQASKKFKDAFVVEERGASEDLKLAAEKARTGAVAGAPMRPSEYSYQPATASSKGLTLTPKTAEQPLQLAVQVASFDATKKVVLNDYADLANLGDVYIKPENGMLKVRVGNWTTHAEADAVQDKIMKRGYRDAMIVVEKPDAPAAAQPQLEPKSVPTAPAQYSAPTLSPNTPQKSAPAPVTYSTTAPPKSPTKYYVRVLALQDPDNFDPKKLAGINGTIEKWNIGNTQMIAIMMSGYPTQESAIEANEKARTAGFPDAFVMKEENGKLSRVKY